MFRTLVFIVLLVLPAWVNAQTLFRQIYSVNAHKTVGGVFTAKCRDANLLVAATCVNQGGWSGPVLFKISSANGDVLWAKKPVVDGENMRITAMQTGKNGEVLLTGLCQPSAMIAEYRPFIMLLDETGKLKWTIQLDVFVLSQDIKAVFLTDNSIIFAGTPANTPFTRPVIYRISESGTRMWMRHLDYDIPYTGSTLFRDVIPDPAGGFIICTSNYFGGSETRAGIIHMNAGGEVIASTNLATAAGDDLFIGSLTGSSANMMLAARMGHAVCSVKLRNLTEVEWQSSPVSIGFSVKDFSISNGPLNDQSFLFGTHEKTDLGFEDLCILRMDSMMFGDVAIMSIPDHTLDSWNAGVTAIDEILFLPGTIRKAGNDNPEMMLTAITGSFKGCEAYSDFILTGVFPAITTSSYPVITRPDNNNRSLTWMLLLQEDVLINTTKICSKEHSSCRSKLDIGPDHVLCKSDPLVLRAPVYSGYQYRWSTSDTTSSITITQTGKYTLQLVPPRGSGCDTLYDTVQVTYTELPGLKIIASAAAAWPGEQVLFTMNNTSFDSIKWMRDGVLKGTHPVYEETFVQNGIYRVKLHAWMGSCEATDSAEVMINGYSLFVPDVFTPNSDHINEQFAPRGKGIVHYKLAIYNKWGELVHESENEGWSGGEAIPGTYVYLIEVRTDKGITSYREGKVELIR